MLPRLPRAPSLLLCASILLTLLGCLRAAARSLELINSDLLFFPMLYTDMAGGRYPVQGWIFSASPYLFPDLATYIVSEWLTSGRAAAICLSVVLFYLMLAASLVWLGRAVSGDWFRPLLIVGLTSAWYTALSAQPAYEAVFWTVTFPGVHGGALIGCILCIAIVVDGLGRKWTTARAIALFAVSSVFLVSDKLFATQTLLPLLVALSIAALLKWIPLRSAIAAAAALTLSYIPLVGYEFAVARWRLHGIAATPVYGLTPGEQWTQFRTMLGDVGLFMVQDAPAYGVIFVAWAGFTIFLIGRGLAAGSPQERRMATVAFWFWAGALITTAAIAHRGIWAGVGTQRYLHNVLVLPLFLLTLFSLHSVNPQSLNPMSGTFRALAALTLCVSFLLLFPTLRVLTPQSFAWPYPSWISCVDEASKRLGLQDGLAEYWYAKQLTSKSRNGLHVDQVGPEFEPFLMSVNRFWYRGPVSGGAHARPEYTFFIPNALSGTQAKEAFGEPAAVRQCPEATNVPSPSPVSIWVYNRPGDLAIRNSLYVMSLLINGEPLPNPGLLPAELTRYKRRNYPSSSPDLLDPGAGVDVTFASPTRGSVVEIGADADDTYDLLVTGADGATASVRVPSAPGKGIQIRFVSIPPPTSLSGVVEIHIRPTGDDGFRRISHLFVYPDSYR